MRCVTPMFRMYELGNHSNGTIISRSEVLERLDFDPNYIRHQMDIWRGLNPYKGLETVACQHCFACALNYSAEWATRIMLEAKKYKNNFWVTLTYDQDHLPIATELTFNDEIFENVGDIKWGEGCLVPEHMDTFLDSLRKHLARKYKHNGVKYYYAGEYGTETHRPHYHIVLMNCPLDITQFYDTHIDVNYKAHWKSHELERYWDKGMIDICELEWSDAAYTARYCAKKLFKKTSDRQYYEEGKKPEFVRMSKDIGMDYFTENVEKIYKLDGLVAKTVKGNVTQVKPPRAYDKKLKELNPELYEEVRKSRKHIAERVDKMLKKLSDYTDAERMRMDAERLATKSSLLPREGEF